MMTSPFLLFSRGWHQCYLLLNLLLEKEYNGLALSSIILHTFMYKSTSMIKLVCKLMLVEIVISSRHVVAYDSKFRAARFTTAFENPTDYYIGERFEWKCEAGIIPGSTWSSGWPESIQIRFNAPGEFLNKSKLEAESKYVGCSRTTEGVEYFEATWFVTPDLGLDWEDIHCEDVTDTLYLRGKITANMAELFSDYSCEIWWDIHSWTDVSTISIAPQKLSYVCPLKETLQNITMIIFGELVEHNEVKAQCTSLGGVPLSVYIYGE